MSKKALMLLVLMLAFWMSVAAQPAKTGREMLKSLIEQYSETKGVDGMVYAKGTGLEMVKMALRKDFGKGFIKGVDMIIIIDYSNADKNVAEDIRTQTNTLAKDYEQKELPDDITEGNYMRNYFKLNDNKDAISDMIILAENAEAKYVIYFGGEMRGEPKAK